MRYHEDHAIKEILIFSLIIILVFCSGCSVAENPNLIRSSNENLKINEFAELQTEDYSIRASIDHLALANSASNGHVIDVFITVKNTGTKAVSPIWYCKLTDYAGVSTDDIIGAGGHLLYPGESQTSANHVAIYSNKKYDALLKGGMMEVNFFSKESLTSPLLKIGKASWILDFNNNST